MPVTREDQGVRKKSRRGEAPQAAARAAGRPEPVWKKILRLGAFVTCLVLLAGGLKAYQAHAQLDEQLHAMGQQMMRVEDADRQDAPRQLELNGESIYVSSGLVQGSLESILDRFEARCAAQDGGMADTFRVLREQDPRRSSERGAQPSRWRPSMRARQGSQGYVACLDMGSAQLELDGLLDRFTRFEQSGDLSDLGELRYLFAEESGAEPGREGERSVHFVAMWTEGPFHIGELFPAEGDAHGEDIEGLPRPPGARRLLSFQERGLPNRVAVYESPAPDEGAQERFYRERLPAEGFTLLAAGHDEARIGLEQAPPSLVAQKGSELYYLVFDSEGGRGYTTLIRAE